MRVSWLPEAGQEIDREGSRSGTLRLLFLLLLVGNRKPVLNEVLETAVWFGHGRRGEVDLVLLVREGRQDEVAGERLQVCQSDLRLR